MNVALLLTIPLVLGQESAFLDIFSRLFQSPAASQPLLIDIFGESQCSDTSSFLHNQLADVWSELTNDSSIIFNYHPFGVKSSCTRNIVGSLSCQCQHGPFECLLNQLQACVVSALEAPVLYMPIVTCIQGKRSFKGALEECIDNARPRPDLDTLFMARCAQSDLGKKLMYGHAVTQKNIAPEIDWVPWIMLNGERDQQAEYTFRQSLCRYRTSFC